MRKPSSLLAPSRSEVLKQELTEPRPAFRLDMNAFTEHEKLVFHILADSPAPLSLYAIYSKLAGTLAASAIVSKIRSEVAEEKNMLSPKYKPPKKNKQKTDMEQAGQELAQSFAEGLIGFEIINSYLKLKSKDLTQATQEFNKLDYGIRIPSYKTVRRICEDFSDARLIGKRLIGGKVMYYLPTNITEQYGAQLKNLELR